jgi:hypothetical protein
MTSKGKVADGIQSNARYFKRSNLVPVSYEVGQRYIVSFSFPLLPDFPIQYKVVRASFPAP